MAYLTSEVKKVTAQTLQQMKKQGEKISMLTSYDYTMARLVDQAGVDSILIGDSAGNVMAGYADTLPMTVDQMIYHAQSVVRGTSHAFVVCDMPFGSYQVSEEEGVHNALRIVKESGCDAVKLEGGQEIAALISHIVWAGVPVVGHLGLTPQSVHKFGGYGLRAQDKAEAAKLMADAKALCEAGCCAIVLEKVPASLAAEVTRQVTCPTIGIGAGGACDGQVLVVADMLGMTQGFKPKFLRLYANLADTITKAVAQYVSDVKENSFPNEQESY